MIVNKTLYPVTGNMRSINTMHSQLDTLQQQLSTGKRYNTLAEMGSDRMHDINIRARMGRIEGYQANILTVETRLSFYNNSLSRLDEIEDSARALAIAGGYGANGVSFANARNQATNLLREVVDVLNTDITGQYIFGGNASDKKPVEGFDAIMDRFRTFVDERAALDGVGTGGNLTVAATGNVVSLGHAGPAGAGFGLQGPDGAPLPDGYDITFDATAKKGDTVTVRITSPHDRDAVQYLTFTAVDKDTNPVPANSFKLGDTPDETAANFAEVAEKRIEVLSDTQLRSSSTYAAADVFFDGNGENGSPMQWYVGQDSADPRRTVGVNIDESTKAHYGVQANEQGFVELIKGLAVFAVSDSIPDLEDGNAARYDALVSIQRERLAESNNSKPGSIEGIVMELGLASSTINTVKSRHSQYNAQLQTMLADIETAPREEVAMMLLNLQVQLQASYQATAMASQLTLVNYLR